MSSFSNIDSELSFSKLIDIVIKWKILRSLKRCGPPSVLYFLGVLLGIISLFLGVFILDIGVFVKAVFIFLTFLFLIFLPSLKHHKHLLVKIIRSIQFSARKYLSRWSLLNRKLRIIELMILIVYFSLLYIVIKIISKDFNSLLLLFTYSSLIFFSCGFVLEVVNISKLYWDKLILKNILRLLGVIATTLSVIVSRNSINLITKIDSSHFPITISIFTFLLTPFVWIFLAICFLFLFYSAIIFGLGFIQFKPIFEDLFLRIRNNKIFCFLFGMSTVDNNHAKGKSLLIWPSRALGSVTIGLCLVQLITLIASNSFLYQKQIYAVISQGIVYSSYHMINNECKNHMSGEWITLIDSNKASIARMNNSGLFDFSIRNCE